MAHRSRRVEYRPRRDTRTIDYAEVHQLRDEGWTIKEIAEELGVTERSVWRADHLPEVPEVPPDLVRRTQRAEGEERRALMRQLHDEYAVSFPALGEMLGISPMGAYYRMMRHAELDRAPCVRCGGPKEPGKGRTLCDSCRTAKA